jgi:uncharacterized LabA/DUF88 family protein
MDHNQLVKLIAAQVADQMSKLCNKGKIGAIYVDLENLYYSPLMKFVYIRVNRYDFIREIIENVKIMLMGQYNCTINTTNAYADFEKLTHFPMSEFSYNGVKLHFVPGTEHKNSADMKMCIDIVDSVCMKPEIDTYVLITGDLDFMSTVEYLISKNKNVFIASFSESLSSNLGKLIDSNHILFCENLLSPGNREKLTAYKAAQIQKEKEQEEKRQKMEIPWNDVVAGSADKSTDCHNPVKKPEPAKKQSVEKIPDKPRLQNSAQPPVENTAKVLEANFTNNQTNWKQTPLDDQNFWAALNVVISMENELRTKEVWLTPYLRKLTEKLPNLSSGARKGLLANMEKNGVLAITETQLGEGNKFSVIIVNDKHPDVQKMHKTIAEKQEKQAKRERVMATKPEDDDFPPELPRTLSTECVDGPSSDEPDYPVFKPQSSNPPLTMTIDEIKDVFERIFGKDEIWVRASELGVRWKRITDVDFKNAKLTAAESGIINLRGVGGYHEAALASVVNPQPLDTKAAKSS